MHLPTILMQQLKNYIEINKKKEFFFCILCIFEAMKLLLNQLIIQ